VNAQVGEGDAGQPRQFATTRHRSFLSRLIRLVAVVLLLVIIALFGAAVWLYHALQISLPQLDGKLTVSGLSAPVKVVRDKHGVPHITAANLADLFFAQGYVTSQDRLWQMDMSRRAGAGELSEILSPRLFGEGVLSIDKRQRALGIRAVAEKSADALSDEEKMYAEAYASGVNAYITSHKRSLPAEFRLLGYEPRPWTPIDACLIIAEMTQELQFDFVEHMWLREKVLAQLGPQLATDLYPVTSWRDHPPIAAALDVQPSPPAPANLRDAGGRYDRQEQCAMLGLLLPNWPSVEAEPCTDSVLLPGSNNWVVSGRHTATGKPLLSNDMHLSHQVPSVWYESHLTAPGFDVAGVTLPGVPFIAVGHNQRIGWGFTNLGPATYDLYIENINGNDEYQMPSEWRKLQHRRELINLRGKQKVIVDVSLTRHGPIISDVLPGEKRKLALRWTLYEPAIISLPFLEMDRAENWDDFKHAVSLFGTPSVNTVYADVDGHIGYIATGKIPTRVRTSAGVPVSGTDDAHEWTGFIPSNQMPTVLDPPTGIIATANGRITSDKYPYEFALEWVFGARTQRIYEVLESGEKFSSADMLALQTDVASSYDLFLARRFVDSVDHSKNASERARKAADTLRQWNGQVEADSSAPAIVAKSTRELIRMMLEPKLGAAPKIIAPFAAPAGLQRYQWAMRNAWLENTLSEQNRAWLPANYDSFEELLVAALERAISAKGVPNDLSKWKWGELAAVDLKHPLFGRIPLLQRWAGPGHAPQAGNFNTVKQVGNDFGPSQRLTVDFADLDATTLNITTGQSGNILSPYFLDHWPAWYHGTTFRLPFSASAVEADKAHVLELNPAK
jgi:penicillin G amidase